MPAGADEHPARHYDHHRHHGDHQNTPRRWKMIVARNGEGPRLHASARIAATAHIVGNVRVGSRAYVDHGVVVESGGPPIEIGDETVLLAGAIVRSVGGRSRPGFAVHVGARTLVSPSCVLTGCRVGRNCYLATAATVLQGARIGDHARIGAGAIVHATTALPDHARVGMRHVAVPTEDGYLSTPDIEAARKAVADLDFFATAFGVSAADQADLHEQVMTALLDEVHGWLDEPSMPGESQ
jgi:carbonic anhydrase/acetyltransferase-like protein (isoleucine patch superfamily)